MPKPFDSVVIAITFAGAIGAAAIDLKTRRVPNALNALIAVSGFAIATFGIGGATVWAAALGLLSGLVLMLPGHLLGATGAGDVKLLAAFGTLLGPAGIALAFLYTTIAAGVIALLVAAHRGCINDMVAQTAQLAGAHITIDGDVRKASRTFAYAPAIAIGTLAVALGY